MVALANSVAAIAAYLAVAALAWGFADAAMAQPRNLAKFATAPKQGRTGASPICPTFTSSASATAGASRAAARARGQRTLEAIAEAARGDRRQEPLDTILITGDMTDAGISTEWAQVLDAIAAHPGFQGRVLILPGNHDLNIVDRANPARMDLPTSPNRPLRQIRCLSAMNAVQGRHVRVIDLSKECIGGTLEQALQPHEAALERFADIARPILSKEIPEIWAASFPWSCLPPRKTGLASSF